MCIPKSKRPDTDSVDTISIVIREEPSLLLSGTDESRDQYHRRMARESRRDLKIP
jgi:hypothetical protein